MSNDLSPLFLSISIPTIYNRNILCREEICYFSKITIFVHYDYMMCDKYLYVNYVGMCNKYFKCGIESYLFVYDPFKCLNMEIVCYNVIHWLGFNVLKYEELSFNYYYFGTIFFNLFN